MTVVQREEAGITRGSPGYLMSISVDGLFGVYDLLSGPFLAVIRRSKLRCCKGKASRGRLMDLVVFYLQAWK